MTLSELKFAVALLQNKWLNLANNCDFSQIFGKMFF